MAAALLVVVGLAALGGSWLTLRQFGPGVRTGRLMAVTRIVPVAEAIRLGLAGTRRYVGVRGRIDADDEFEDEHHRPLVFRRSRIEAASGRTWRRLDETVDVVEFGISDGPDTIGVEAAELSDGLIVVARESVGSAADLGDRGPGGLDPATPIRLRIEQVSSVEHALVLGVPSADGGRVRMRAGLGRPLVLTTVEPPEAMRLLGSGRRGAAVVAAALLAGGLVAVAIGSAWAIVDVLG